MTIIFTDKLWTIFSALRSGDLRPKVAVWSENAVLACNPNLVSLILGCGINAVNLPMKSMEEKNAWCSSHRQYHSDMAFLTHSVLVLVWLRLNVAR